MVTSLAHGPKFKDLGYSLRVINQLLNSFKKICKFFSKSILGIVLEAQKNFKIKLKIDFSPKPHE